MSTPVEFAALAMKVKVSGEAPTFALHSVQGKEGLSFLFDYTVELLNLDEPESLRPSLGPEGSFKPQELLGQTMTVSVPLLNDKFRYFSGMVTKTWRLGWRHRFASYGVTISPRLWLATLNRNCRIFQDKTVPEVLKEVLDQHSISPTRVSLPGTYRKWDCVTQYRESDFDFISRIMAHEGIYFYFEHSEKGHTLVLANSLSAHDVFQDFEEVLVGKPASDSVARDYVETWRETSAIETDSVSLADYDFRLLGKAAHLSQADTVSVEPKLAELGIYDYPAKCVEQEDQEDAKGDADAGKSGEEGKRLAQMRLEARRCQAEVYRGEGTARWLASGYLFGLANAPAYAGRQFLVTNTSIMLRNALPRAEGEGFGEVSQVGVVAIDSQTPFRAAPVDRPMVWGPQTARVVGPPSQGKDKDDKSSEIWTDKNGRIRVEFHWDRRDATQEKTSCWVRVAHPWAGKGWGAIHIPRVGNEVVVEFLEGDPDRPLVTGSVYNADNMPPYKLPDNKTQSGIKTHSTKDGTPDNFNEIRFEDKKGKEELHIQAEKDMSTHVKHNQSTSVDGDRSVSVGGNQSTTVTKNETQTYKAKRKMDVTGTNDDTITGAHTGIYHAGRTETVEKGDTLTVKDSNKKVDVIGAYDITVKDHLKVTKASTSMTIDDNFVVDASGKIDLHNPGTGVKGEGTKLALTANSEVTITCGASSISMKSDGTIEIKGQTVKIGNASNNAAFEPAGTTINGVKITSAAVGMHEISGALIKVG